MASKDISKVKGLGKDPSLCKLGQRMISTMLREERIAERDLQEKLKAISAKEHKSMVKLGCDSLEVRHDLTRQRSSSPVPGGDGLDIVTNTKGRESSVELGDNTARPGLQGRRAISMIDYSYKEEQASLRVNRGDKTRSNLKSSSQINPTITVENHVENSLQESNGKILNDKTSLTVDGMKSLSLEMLNSTSSPSNDNTSPASASPRLLRRRPVSDVSSSSFTQTSCSSEVDEVIVEKITLEKGLSSRVPKIPTTPPLRVQQRPSTSPTSVPQCPSTPPPVRRTQTTLSADFRKQRPSSARMVRPKSSTSVVTTPETVRGRDRIRLDLPQGSTPKRSPSSSPSPSRLSPEPLGCNLGRRGSGPPRINVNSLPSSSPLRKGLGTSDVTQSLAPNSPDALRRRLSANEEDLQDRVQGFLKTLGKK